MSSLDLKGLNKIYPNGVQAVYDFDLHVNDGEFVVLVGPSGCGKTTTLRMIAGLEDISSGNLIIDDKDVSKTPAKERDISMVFQNYALYSHMTVYENMAFSLVLRKEKANDIHKKVMAAAEILGLNDQLNKKPRQLSGGQRQRVAIGRAIVRNPKVFLFDEPLSNLDAKLRNSMRRELLLLHQKLGATMIYVTHDQIEALTLADKIVCMSMGYVQQIGTPLDLYDNPSNLFVASFIGLPPMNLIDVMVTKNATIKCEHFEVPLSNEQKEVLKDYVGKEVVFGIRPEDILEDGQITFKININENTGQTTILHGFLESKNECRKLVCKIKRWCKYQLGDVIKIGFIPEKMHFFDKDTTNAIRK